MFRLVYLKLFLLICLFVPDGFALTNQAVNRQNEYDVMTENIICIPATKDGRIFFSDKHLYGEFSAHLRAAGLDPRLISFSQFRKGILVENNGDKKEEAICKDAFFLFIDGLAAFAEEFDDGEK